VFPVGKDGRLGEASDFIQHQGSGPNHDRQEKAHAHWIDLSPDNRFALNADLGLDEVFVYRFDATKGKLTPNGPPFAKVAAGAGPRHVAFHSNGRFAYVIDELNSTLPPFPTMPRRETSRITKCAHAAEGLHWRKQYCGDRGTSNGKFLYASNRGHDSLAVFAIDPATGTLKFAEHVSVREKRHATLRSIPRERDC